MRASLVYMQDFCDMDGAAFTLPLFVMLFISNVSPSEDLQNVAVSFQESSTVSTGPLRAQSSQTSDLKLQVYAKASAYSSKLPSCDFCNDPGSQTAFKL
jgi:hypothetical protein